jgi:tRNA-splicing endonuclease subunit Sen54
MIPFHSPMETPRLCDFRTKPSPSITFHVYKPNAVFKKTNPGPPDFYISVLNARDFEMLREPNLDILLGQTPFHPPKVDAHVYAKLKNGVRNVILAIVDEGVTSFLNISDAAFGLNPLWNRPPPRPGKKGGFKGKRRSHG